jgi:DNA-directed RNA polymerase
LELKAKEKDLDAMNKLIGGQAETLESERKKLLKIISIRNNECAKMKDFESMKKRLEGQIEELESKQKQCKRWGGGA